MNGEIDPASLSGGGWAAVLTGVAVTATAAYKALRRVKVDGADDRVAARNDAATSEVIKMLKAEIERLTAAQAHLTKRVDEMAEARNKAREEAAVAQARSLVLQGKIESLEKDMAELKEELMKVEAERDELKADNGLRRRATDFKPVDDRDVHKLGERHA